MRSFTMPTYLWRRGMITLLAYFAGGVLAMISAAPGSPVSQLYIAAGIALGLTLGWGRGMLLPIALGGMGVVFIGHSMMGSAFSWPIVMTQAIVSGGGAALQAWIARRLVTPTPRGPADVSLDRAASIGRFLLLAGPVACLTNAAVSVPSMVLLGIMPAAAAPLAFLQWWAADTMGVMVATPFVLAWVGHPRPLWRARRWVVGVPMGLATVMLGMAIHHIQRWDLEREAALFEEDIVVLKSEAALKLNGYLHALQALHGLYQSSEDVSREEFQKASQYWLANLEGIQAVGWSAHLTRQELTKFEQTQSKVHHGYRVFDRADHAREPMPPKGKAFVAITYIEPLRGNERALGTNILSLTQPRQAYERALEIGQSTATPSFMLTQTTGQQAGVVVYRPVVAATGEVKGTLFLTLKLDETLGALLRGIPSYLGTCLLEDRAQRKAVVPGQEVCSQTYATALTPHRREIQLDFAGTTWYLQVWAAKPIPLVGRGMVIPPQNQCSEK